MSDPFDDILDKAEEMTNAELDTKISSLVRLTDDELRKLFPTKVDKEQLAKLMSVVKGATSENNKKKQIIKNISSYAGIVVKLLKKAL
jgi:hypothetical protein